MKNPHAVALGRKGGKASRRLARASPEERQAVARAGAAARWLGHRKNDPGCECRGCQRRYSRAAASSN